MSLRKNRGQSLLETVVAASMGVSLLLVVLNLLINFNHSAGRLSKQMMLNQELSVVTRRLVNDLIRAGSSYDTRHALLPIGSTLPVYVSSDGDTLQYSYWDDRDSSDDSDGVKNYVWKYQSTQQKLSVCYLTSSRLTGPKAVGFDRYIGCTSVFEPDRVSVTHFQLQSNEFKHGDVQRQWLQLEVILQHRQDPKVRQAITRQVWVRNGV